MLRFGKRFLGKIPYIRKLLHQVEQQGTRIGELIQQVERQGAFPPGHYYSPIPDKDDVLAYIKSRQLLKVELHGIKSNDENQFKLLDEYAHFYKDLPFQEKQTSQCRYYYDNDFYSYSDAIFLYSFLRKHEPKRIIEIGSGFSSAVMLDTVDRFFSYRPEITFIDPYPDRLRSLLRNDDIDEIRIIDKRIQEVSSELFLSLESGDFLLIDSSHVVKCGSDLHQLMFDILPLLPSGIFVHFHDVFYPFDYPSDWLEEGRYWNENYFLRAFLSYNCQWDIYFFNGYIALAFNDFIKDRMPLCIKNAGASLYIKRVKKD
jgi:predicted O-methyltransferase YrrM